ncbi:hypothetical protein [Rhodoligotrophos ferricapiens]|uniref:hypothetical protein n=1 Tax=Rhodoligotrophos ferricapiens TaxID=3069264 RepID=UPI00315D0492
MAETLYLSPSAMRAGGGKFDTAKDYLTKRPTGYGMAGGKTWYFFYDDNHPGARYSVNGFVRTKYADTQPSGDAEVTLVEPASSRVVSTSQRGLTAQNNQILITAPDGRVVLDTNEKLFLVTDHITGSITPPARARGYKDTEDFFLADVTPGSSFVVGTLTFINNNATRWMNAGGTFVSFWAKNSSNYGPSVNAIRGLSFIVENNELLLRDQCCNGEVNNPEFNNIVGNLINYNLLIGTFV